MKRFNWSIEQPIREDIPSLASCNGFNYAYKLSILPFLDITVK